MNKKKVIIIGGGASGFFCAANIDGNRYDITILEKSNKLLSKVAISGGGRCNVTNASYEKISDFARQYPRGSNLLKKTLHHFSYQDTIRWFQDKGVQLVAEADGRMFPVTNNSQTIVDCLYDAAIANGTQVQMQAAVTKIIPIANAGYTVHTPTQTFQADIVVMATGAFPKLLQYELYTNTGIDIVPPVPSLFTFNLPKHEITSLMGVAVPLVTVKLSGTKLVTEGPILITHWGLSGPAILRMSAWAAVELAAKSWQFEARINWLHQVDETSLRNDFQSIRICQGNKNMYTKNPFVLPSRLWTFLLQAIQIPESTTWSTLTAAHQSRLIIQLTNYAVQVSGKTTFKEEFVTAGGVQLSDMIASEMRHKHFPNIFIIGEALNVDGITGGFNFQHAWTSGFIAAQRINAEK